MKKIYIATALAATITLYIQQNKDVDELTIENVEAFSYNSEVSPQKVSDIIETYDENTEKRPDITKIIEIDNQLYIFDRTLNQITVFDKAGRFIRTINHMGHGKGEYIHLMDVTYDKKGGELLCLADPSSIIHYTADGTYTGTDRLHGFYTDISCDDSFIYLYHSTYADAKTPEYRLRGECPWMGTYPPSQIS